MNATGEVVTRVAVGLATWCAGAATLKADTANAAKRAKRMAAMLRILTDFVVWVARWARGLGSSTTQV